VLVVPDHPRREPVFEEVPAALIRAVETLRVEPVEAVHGVRHLLTLRLDNKVVVRTVV